MAAEGGSDRGDDAPPRCRRRQRNGQAARSVERLTHQDIPDICALYKRVWDAFRPELPRELVKAWEPSPLEFTSWMEGVTYFAARRDGRMIGAVGCAIEDGALPDRPPRRRPRGPPAGDRHRARRTPRVEWAEAQQAATPSGSTRSPDSRRPPRCSSGLGFTECGVLHRHRWNEDVRLFEKLL